MEIRIRNLGRALRLSFLLLLLYSGGLLSAQTGASQSKAKATISGYILDDASGEKLIGASIYIKETLDGTSSNAYGFYSLTVDTGQHQVIFSFIGYAPVVRQFDLTSDIEVNISLGSNIELEEVVISAEEIEKIEEQSQMSAIELPVNQIKSLPAFLGEVDVLKTIQLLPGVQSGSEGNSGLYVRGGGPDQNLILLDGVPVYNASHLFGFFSVFNADAINKVELIKGGFPARFGGRLSSVVDIRMKEGNSKELHGEGAIGLIASKLTLEGPIVKDKSSFLVSGRRTYIDILAQPFILAQSDGDGTGGYYFYDLNAKFNHKFSDKDRLYLSGYFGRDRFYFRETYRGNSPGVTDVEKIRGGLDWGNATAVLRWNHVINNKLFSNVTATFSDYQFDISNSIEEIYDDGTNREESFFGLRYFSGIQDWAGSVDFDYLPTPNHYIRFGASATIHSFRPGATEFKNQIDNEELDTLFESGFTNAGEYRVYIEDDFKLGSSIKINAGLHLSGFSVNDVFYNSLEPRLSMRYLVAPGWSAKASYARMTQYIHLLSNVGVGLPTDLWVPSTDQVEPQKSQQVAVGLAHTLGSGIELSVEGYYKEMRDLIEYKDGSSFLEDGSTRWEDKVAVGDGESYGAEFFVQKKKGKTTGWIGYTLSWTYRQSPEINFGDKYPYRYDRRHDLSIAMVHKISDQIELSAAWVYGTGNAISLPVAKYQGPFGETIFHYEGRNGFRMQAYHRLDFNARFTKEKKKYTRSFNIGLYNAYNRRNPFFVYLGNDFSGNDEYKQVSLFPVLPSFSWQFKF